MRVVAARFTAPEKASAVLDLLQRQMNLDPPDVSIAPLATPDEKPSDDDTVLAGRFPDEQAQAVIELVRRAGGEVVADVDERYTRPVAMAAFASSGRNGGNGHGTQRWRTHS